MAPAYAAVIVTGVEAPTGPVAMVKVAVVDPAGTVTVAGTLAAPLLLERTMVAPPVGAAPLSTTVPWVDVPPVIDDTAAVSAASTEG